MKTIIKINKISSKYIYSVYMIWKLTKNPKIYWAVTPRNKNNKTTILQLIGHEISPHEAKPLLNN
jgi:hypothetical protein